MNSSVMTNIDKLIYLFDICNKFNDQNRKNNHFQRLIIFLILGLPFLVKAQVSQNLAVNLACVVPSSMSYTVNSAFYCTGLPIAPNILTYNGTAATSYNINPDLPDGLNFDISNGTISGTPTASVSGNYTVTIINPCGFTAKTIYISVSTGTNYYADSDGDGYGTGVASVSCTGQPAGTSTNDTDCAPADSTKWRTALLFTDADSDGYDNGMPRVNVCYGASIPSGYLISYIGADCDDTNPKINPNAVEIMGNGKDDNCDGQIDEVMSTTKLSSGSCGVTLANLSNTLFANLIAGAQGYRFEVTNNNRVSTYDATSNQFNLLNLSPGVSYSSTNTHNTVRVAAKLGGYWRAYGQTCSVTTPPVPNSTSISNPACGTVLTNIWNTIFCYNIPGATAYRFRVKQGSTLVGTFDSPVNNFNLVNLGAASLSFGVTYTIDVLLQMYGTWLPDSDYGTPCNIITPPTPGVSRVTSPSCGSSTNNLWTSIFILPVVGAQGYKFVLNNGVQSREIISTSTQFSIHDIPGGPMPGTNYTIRIDVLYNNSYVPGREICTLNILPTATRLTRADSDLSDVKLFPNPFEDHFELQITEEVLDPIYIYVYDMLGREMQNLTVSNNTDHNIHIGQNYPSGVYQVVMKQSDQVKTIRMIKR